LANFIAPPKGNKNGQVCGTVDGWEVGREKTLRLMLSPRIADDSSSKWPTPGCGARWLLLHSRLCDVSPFSARLPMFVFNLRWVWDHIGVL